MTNARSYLLSLAQERLWLFQQLHPQTAVYHLPVMFRLCGDIDVSALRRSIKAIVRRHEPLRTTFRLENGRPAQMINRAAEVDLQLEDLTLITDDARNGALQQRMKEALNVPFDLVTGPLLRVRLLRLAPKEHALLIVFHHIIADGWSIGVFCAELSRLYSADIEDRPAHLPRLGTRYGKFSERQRRRFNPKVLSKELEFWKDQLTGIPNALELPTDRPRPAVGTHRGALESLVIPRKVSQAVKSASQRLRATPFMVLLAGFQALLGRYSGQPDVVVTSPVAGRSEVSLEPLIGEFANAVPIRADLRGDPTFADLVAQVRRRVLTTYEHKEMQFDELVSALKFPRSLSFYPFSQVIFVLQSTSRVALSLSGLQVQEMEVEWNTARVDLSLMLEECGEQFLGRVEYSTDIFEAASVRRFIGHYVSFLRAATADPTHQLLKYPLLSAAEREQAVVTWNATVREYPQTHCLHELFRQQVLRTPDATAVVDGEKQWNYAQLDMRANKAANFLRRCGVRLESRVAVQLDRSLDWIAVVLGIMKAGGVYVPLDPRLPQSRATHIVQDAGATLVITEAVLHREDWPADTQVMQLGQELPAIEKSDDTLPVSGVNPRNVAYLIYTSGSTGHPKGVAIEHRSVANLKEAQGILGVGPSDRVLQFSPPSFDASIFEIVLALLRGATLVLRPARPLVGPLLSDLLERERISATVLPPSILSTAPAKPLPALKTLMIAGEAAAPEVYTNWSPRRNFWNLYGPTEATVWVSATAAASAADSSNIGAPVSNTQAYVLDSALQPLPLGIPGELYIGGAGLARGYWNNPALTAEAFRPNPFSDEPGARMYRSGDRVRRRADGTLEFLGRVDHQIKLRGFRIELGEIERALSEHPGVRASAVIRDSRDSQQLIAFVVVRDGVATESALRAYLKARLPEFMVPATIVPVDDLPLGSTGKVDRRALATMEIPTSLPGPQNVVCGDNSTGAAIASVWQRLLSRADVRVDENFFDAGGNSLLIVRLYDALRPTFGPALTIADLFQYPTIASLAAYLSERHQPETALSAVAAEDVAFPANAAQLLEGLRSRQL